jgi:superfamily I DNA and/or RNA helicase
MPMLLGKQIVLVGDHHQLPPLFRLREDELPLSETDDDDSIKLRFKKFEKLVTSSYFEEMFIKAGDSLKSRLTEQYRMHPTIMNLINQFYPPDYQLTCGMINPDIARQHPYVIVGDNQVLTSKNAHTVWIDTSQRRVQNKLIDNFENKEEGKFNSRFNQYEVEVIRKILCSMSKQISGSENKNRDIAVISFYAGQVRKLKQMIDSLRQNGSVNNLNIRVGTVDQFQGMERPIVITSLVSSPEKKNGKRKPTAFVKEFRRINVAFSRAQSMLIVVGSVDVFNDVPVDVNFGYQKERKKPYKFLIEMGKDRVNGSNYVRGYDINE